MAAEIVLALHMLVVVFNVGGLVAIIVGGLSGWRWTRGRSFRVTHLALAALVTLEAVFGITCPLTAWEDSLRGTETTQSFIGRGLAALLYWNAPLWTFAVGYAAYLGLVVWAWWKWPVKK